VADIGFYVVLIRDKRVAYLLGPYDFEELASWNADRGWSAAERIDPFCCFDERGIMRVDTCRKLPPGKLNASEGLWPPENIA
jgi:hypothetical protein